MFYHHLCKTRIKMNVIINMLWHFSTAVIALAVILEITSSISVGNELTTISCVQEIGQMF